MIKHFYQIFPRPEIFEPEPDLIQELGGLLFAYVIEVFHWTIIWFFLHFD